MNLHDEKFKAEWFKYVDQKQNELVKWHGIWDYTFYLVANVYAASHFLTGQDELEGQRIVEVGTGHNWRNMHVRPLSWLGADVIGIDPDTRAVAQVAGNDIRKAVDMREGDVLDIEEILDGFVPDYIISCGVYEMASGFENVSLAALPEEYTERRRRKLFPNALESMRRNYQVMPEGGIQIHTVVFPFIPFREDLEDIGYKVLAYNMLPPELEEPVMMPIITIFQK